MSWTYDHWKTTEPDPFEHDYPPDEPEPCPVCGNEERNHAGYLICECPAPLTPR